MPTPETLFGGKYRTVRPLGEGGMGTVFEVENLLTQKRAAIKWLHPRFQSGEGFAKRMLREARAMARTRHQNLVDVYDVLLDDENICLVMELLHGELLSDRLARAPIAVAEFLSLLLPAMRGVAAAHAVGVVHRDVKPDNIFLAHVNGHDAPIPKVIDFGISKMFNSDEESGTCSGVTMGTPRYVSYEQLRGLRDVDGRTDTYAFGVILYEALTGRPPYEAESLGQQAIQFVTCVPEPIRALRPVVPEQLAQSVERAIARDRDRRHDSLSELVEELGQFALSEALLRDLPAFPPVPSVPTKLLVDAARTTAKGESLAPVSDRARSTTGPRRASGKRFVVRAASPLGLVVGVVALAMSGPEHVEEPVLPPSASEVQVSPGLSSHATSPVEPRAIDPPEPEHTSTQAPMAGRPQPIVAAPLLNREASTRRAQPERARTTRGQPVASLPATSPSPPQNSGDELARASNTDTSEPPLARSGPLDRSEF